MLRLRVHEGAVRWVHITGSADPDYALSFCRVVREAGYGVHVGVTAKPGERPEAVFQGTRDGVRRLMGSLVSGETRPRAAGKSSRDPTAVVTDLRQGVLHDPVHLVGGSQPEVIRDRVTR
jgi:hypothetical protein